MSSLPRPPLQRWEYRGFLVWLPWNGPVLGPPDIKDWPDQTMLQACESEMNKLGQEGWQIFERAYPVMAQPKTKDDLYPMVLWARRLL